MKKWLYGVLWRHLIRIGTWPNDMWYGEILGLGNIKSMNVVNSDLVIVVDGNDQFKVLEDRQIKAKQV